MKKNRIKSTQQEQQEATVKAVPVHSSLLSDFDISLFKEGRHYMLYKHLGAHRHSFNGKNGVQFSVWAPAANSVSVTGDFNNWDKETHKMYPRWDHSGIWEIFIPGIAPGTLYKYHITNISGFSADKADPFAFETEMPPHTASRVAVETSFKWSDKRWLNKRLKKPVTEQPLSIYEIHIGSWRRIPEEGNRWLTYREIAGYLPRYCADMGFTHVEFLPLMEHPF